MTEIDQIWHELHDAETRLGRVEDKLIEVDAQSTAAKDAEIQRIKHRQRFLKPLTFVPLIFGTLSTIFALLKYLGVL